MKYFIFQIGTARQMSRVWKAILRHCNAATRQLMASILHLTIYLSSRAVRGPQYKVSDRWNIKRDSQCNPPNGSTAVIFQWWSAR